MTLYPRSALARVGLVLLMLLVAGMACSLGTSGAASFDPALDNAFFVIVANDASYEGSYGTGSDDVERPQALSGVCDLPQNLGNRCDAP